MTELPSAVKCGMFGGGAFFLFLVCLMVLLRFGIKKEIEARLFLALCACTAFEAGMCLYYLAKSFRQ